CTRALGWHLHYFDFW
nr:immunoglobulin heavy chain junction region [Macaca mulatta]